MPVLENMNLCEDNAPPEMGEPEKRGVTAQEVYSKSWNFERILCPRQPGEGGGSYPEGTRTQDNVKRLDETIREDLGWYAASPPKIVHLGGPGASESTPSKLGPGTRMKPSKYDGQTPYEDYQVQFEMLAQLNGWTKDVKALYLAGCLSGSARSVLNDIGAIERYDYDKLEEAL